MRIAIISAIKPYEGSGSGITEYTYQLLTHLKRLLSKADQVTTLYTLKRVKGNNIKGLFYTNTLFKRSLLKTSLRNYDVIHITDHEMGFVARLLKESGTKAKIITTVHDLSRFEKILHRGMMQKIYNRLVITNISDATRYSDVILCNSTQTYETIKQRFPRRINMHIVPNGVDDGIIRHKQYPKKKSKFTIGYIGALLPHKNVIFILKIAEHLRNLNTYRFKIYGSGVELHSLLKYKNSKSLSNVEFGGLLPERQKIKMYDSFDAFVFPSYYEGFGLPILEAQARGLPVIIYKHCKIPKEVRKYCLEAENPADAARIIECIKRGEYKKIPMQRARKYSRRFTWNKNARATLEIYKRVCFYENNARRH